MLEALQSGPFRRFWLGSVASVGAVQLYHITMAWLVFELSGSPLDLGVLGAAVAVPAILATLAGGLVADRMDRRAVLLVTTAATAGFLVLLAVLDLMAWVRVWHVLIIAAALGLISGFDFPARISIFPALIQPHQMMSAVALGSILWQGTRMVLPGIGGLLIAWSDTSVVLFICTFGFIAMFWVLITLDIESRVVAEENAITALMKSFQFIIANPPFYVLIGLSWATMFFGTSYIQIMPVFSDLLGGDERGYGLLVSATGVGSVLGTLVIGRYQRSRHFGLTMLLGAAGAAVTLGCFGLVIGFAAGMPGAFQMACFFAVLTGMLNSFFLISSMTALQIWVPDGLRGRVMGIHSICFSLIALGGLVMGPLATFISAPAAVLSGATVVLVITLAVILRYPEIRRLDGRRLGDMSPHPSRV
jgi:MFS family permease